MRCEGVRGVQSARRSAGRNAGNPRNSTGGHVQARTLEVAPLPRRPFVRHRTRSTSMGGRFLRGETAWASCTTATSRSARSATFASPACGIARKHPVRALPGMHHVHGCAAHAGDAVCAVRKSLVSALARGVFSPTSAGRPGNVGARRPHAGNSGNVFCDMRGGVAVTGRREGGIFVVFGMKFTKTSESSRPRPVRNVVARANDVHSQETRALEDSQARGASRASRRGKKARPPSRWTQNARRHLDIRAHSSSATVVSRADNVHSPATRARGVSEAWTRFPRRTRPGSVPTNTGSAGIEREHGRSGDGASTPRRGVDMGGRGKQSGVASNGAMEGKANKAASSGVASNGDMETGCDTGSP